MKRILITFFLIATGSATANQADLITADFSAIHAGYDAKHTPKIEAPEKVKAGEWFEVTVSVGAGAEHPSLLEHHVHWIALYNGDVELARVYLHPVQAKPKVTFTIALKESATLKAIEEPNHTAPWVAMKKVRVVR